MIRAVQAQGRKIKQPVPVRQIEPVEITKKSSDDLKKLLDLLDFKSPLDQKLLTYKNFDWNDAYEYTYSGGINNIFDNPIFNEQKENENEYINSMTRSVNVIESIYKCDRCGYNRIIADQKQLRGGDESATTRFRCVRCGNQWSNSG